MAKRKKRKSKRKKKKYYAVAVIIGKDGKGKTLGRGGSTAKEAVYKLVTDSARYGTIASIGVYRNGKEVLYKEYPIIKKLRR